MSLGQDDAVESEEVPTSTSTIEKAQIHCLRMSSGEGPGMRGPS
jgi:hypothetical protein